MRRAAVPQKFHTQETKEVRTRTGTLWFRRKGGAVPSESELNKSNKEHNSKHSLLDSIAGDMSLPPSLPLVLPPFHAHYSSLFTSRAPVLSQAITSHSDFRFWILFTLAPSSGAVGLLIRTREGRILHTNIRRSRVRGYGPRVRTWVPVVTSAHRGR